MFCYLLLLSLVFHLHTRYIKLFCLSPFFFFFFFLPLLHTFGIDRSSIGKGFIVRLKEEQRIFVFETKTFYKFCVRNNNRKSCDDNKPMKWLARCSLFHRAQGIWLAIAHIQFHGSLFVVLFVALINKYAYLQIL